MRIVSHACGAAANCRLEVRFCNGLVVSCLFAKRKIKENEELTYNYWGSGDFKPNDNFFMFKVVVEMLKICDYLMNINPAFMMLLSSCRNASVINTPGIALAQFVMRYSAQ